MTSKEALERLGNVEVAVTTIRSGITHFKTLKEQYTKEFEALEKELLFVRDIKPFDVYEGQYKKLEKENQELKEKYKKRAELSKELCEGLKQYEKVLDFLIGKFKLELKEGKLYFLYNNQYFEIDKENEEMLKSVLEEE